MTQTRGVLYNLYAMIQLRLWRLSLLVGDVFMWMTLPFRDFSDAKQRIKMALGWRLLRRRYSRGPSSLTPSMEKRSWQRMYYELYERDGEVGMPRRRKVWPIHDPTSPDLRMKQIDEARSKRRAA